ncbi:hypothetical protein OAU50_00810 [Planctomycetota bacterium]|nr:hypothetical protein [Planctomycetota bacterium]
MSEKLRAEICRVFADWQAAKMTCQGVQHWARDASSQGADPYAATIVNHLRGLGEYLITTDDIPTYLEGMEKDPAEGVTWLASVGNDFDAKARATDLKNDPFYGPHTRAILKDIE